MINIKIIEEMMSISNMEIREIVSNSARMKKEHENILRKNDILIAQYLVQEKTIKDIKEENTHLRKKLKKKSRKSRNKYKNMKMELVTEILYLKSKLYDKNNIYEVKGRKTQNIVKLS